MARQVIALAMVFFALVGLASAASGEKAPARGPTANPPKASSGVGAPVDENVIGTTDEGGDHGASAPSRDNSDLPVPGPLGSDVTYDSYPSAQPPKSAATALHGVSAVAGVVAFAGSVFFF